MRVIILCELLFNTASFKFRSPRGNMLVQELAELDEGGRIVTLACSQGLRALLRRRLGSTHHITFPISLCESRS